MDSKQVTEALAAESIGPLRIELAAGTFLDVPYPDSIFLHGNQLLVIQRQAAVGKAISSFRFIDLQLVRDIVPVELAQAFPSGQLAEEPLAKAELFGPASHTLSWLETLLSLLAASLICAVVAFSGVTVYLSLGKSTTTATALSLLLWLVMIVVEGVVLADIVRFYRKRIYPLPLLYALAATPSPHGPIRLATAAFWLAHAGAGILAFTGIDFFMTSVNLGRQSADHWFEFGVLLVCVTAGAHASMCFLLLAARALGATPRLLRRLWAFRILIDAFVVGAVAFLPTPGLQWLLQPTSSLVRQLHFFTRS